MNSTTRMFCSSLWSRVVGPATTTTTKTTAPSSSSTSFQSFQQRFKSKYLSKSASKRLPMTTKRAGKGFYKGKGSTKEGKINSKGKFIVDPSKRLELVVPDLTGFKVRCVCEQLAAIDTLKKHHVNRPLANTLSFPSFVFHSSQHNKQLKPYIASTASRFEPEIRRRPGQVE